MDSGLYFFVEIILSKLLSSWRLPAVVMVDLAVQCVDRYGLCSVIWFRICIKIFTTRQHYIIMPNVSYIEETEIPHQPLSMSVLRHELMISI
jgi:hypothetical protein